MESMAATGALAFDVSDGGTLLLRGEDRQAFLHNFCTNNIETLESGATVEAFVTDMRGRVLSHVWVHNARETLWLQCVASPVEPLRDHFDRYIITEDVTLDVVTGQVERILVSGEAAGNAADRIAEALGSQGLEDLHRMSVDWLGTGDILLTLGRSDAESDATETESTVLLLAAVACGLPIGTPESFTARRVAAGLPVVGVDIGPSDLAQEVERDDLAIAFDKGCYLGQETIARVQSRGQVNRLLRGVTWSVDSEAPPDRQPQVGAVIRMAGDETHTPRGTLTSIVPPEHAIQLGTGRALGLSIVRREAVEGDGGVEIETPAGWVPAKLVTRQSSPVVD